MRLLQVNNVGTRLGGTGSCAWSIAMALPGVSHRFHFFSGSSDHFKEYACSVGPEVPKNELDEADVIIWHNSSRMPANPPPNAINVFYQHSQWSGAKDIREKCDTYLCVSRYLAKTAGIEDDRVLYQPVLRPSPDRDNADWKGDVIRICTPNVSKWQLGDFLPVCQSMADMNLAWSFVGCPKPIQKDIESVLSKVSFSEASLSAPGMLLTHRSMIYSSRIPETYGRVVCESQMSGCVPIVRNIGAFPEQIEHGKTGFLCDKTEDFRVAFDRIGEIDTRAMQSAAEQRSGLSVWRDRFMDIIGRVK